MGGEIAVTSELNKGSRFSFTVRCEAVARVISPTAQVVSSLAGSRVLVVDDNQLNRLIVREMIANCGAEVDEAESGPHALEALRRAMDEGKAYRIVLLDMRMPEMDGLEVARRIHTEKWALQPLILMLSSDDVRPQIGRLKELGLEAYLIKPLTRKELFAAMGGVIQEANRNSSDALPERPSDNATSAEANQGAAPQSSLRILIAEDSSDSRLLVQAFLKRQPHQLKFVTNGQEAVDEFLANPCDLVLMDIQMPARDGLSATGAIRTWEKEHQRAPVPIIALTASVLPEDAERAMVAGCSLHICKPVKKQVLLDAIRKITTTANVVPSEALPPAHSADAHIWHQHVQRSTDRSHAASVVAPLVDRSR
jgi:CheY-like chemotaxis protein